MVTITQEHIAAQVKRFRQDAQEARYAFAESWIDAEAAGERPDLEPIVFEIGVERAEEAADMLEQLAAERNPDSPVTVSSTEQDLGALVEYFKAKAEKAYADGVRDAAKVCDKNAKRAADRGLGNFTAHEQDAAEIRALLTEKDDD